MSDVLGVHFDLWCDPALQEDFGEILEDACDSLERDYTSIQGSFPPFQPRAAHNFRIYVHARFELPAGPNTVGIATREAFADAFHCVCPEGIGREDFREDFCASIVALLVQDCSESTLNWKSETCMGQGLCLAVAGDFYRDAIGVFDPTERAWRDTSPLVDYVNAPAPDANNSAANGCLFLFLSWLHSKGYGWHQLVLAGLPAQSTPRDIYRFLTGDEDDPFPAFAKVVTDASQAVVDTARLPSLSQEAVTSEFPEELLPDEELYQSPGWNLAPVNFEAGQAPAPGEQGAALIRRVPLPTVLASPKSPSLRATEPTEFDRGNVAPQPYQTRPAATPSLFAVLSAPYPPHPPVTPNPPLPPYPPYRRS